MYRVWLPFALILAGVILLLRRDYPDKYMGTPSYPKQTMNAHFAMINMIRKTEEGIKHKRRETLRTPIVGVFVILSGVITGIVFYYMP